MNEIPNIYPQELVLNRTSESDVHVAYLDINISIKHNYFTTNVFLLNITILQLMCLIKEIILILR